MIITNNHKFILWIIHRDHHHPPRPQDLWLVWLSREITFQEWQGTSQQLNAISESGPMNASYNDIKKLLSHFTLVLNVKGRLFGCRSKVGLLRASPGLHLVVFQYIRPNSSSNYGVRSKIGPHQALLRI